MPAAVILRSVSKRFDSVTAVRHIGFEINSGEIFGLIGPNGAGKTTLLECILGLIAPTSGSIVVGGIDIAQNGRAAKHLLGAQLQASALPDAMTPRQALKLCGAFYARPASPDELLEQFELRDKADAKYATLSAGQRQRVALALALVSRPAILVLDEPTAGLDPASRADLHRLILAQRAAGRTVLFSTHYLEEARTLCDRVALLNRGSMLALDTPAALIAASGAQARLVVHTVPALSQRVRALPEVADAESNGTGGWILRTHAINRTLTALIRLAEEESAALQDIQIQQPTLDDALAAWVRTGTSST